MTFTVQSYSSRLSDVGKRAAWQEGRLRGNMFRRWSRLSGIRKCPETSYSVLPFLFSTQEDYDEPIIGFRLRKRQGDGGDLTKCSMNF